MITVIDTITNKCHLFECYSDAGKFIGITAQTLKNWEEKKLTYKHDLYEQYSHYRIYFQPQKHKAKKGYAIL